MAINPGRSSSGSPAAHTSRQSPADNHPSQRLRISEGYSTRLNNWVKYQNNPLRQGIAGQIAEWIELGNTKAPLVLKPDRHNDHMGDVDLSRLPLPVGVEVLDLTAFRPSSVSLPIKRSEHTHVYLARPLEELTGASEHPVPENVHFIQSRKEISLRQAELLKSVLLYRMKKEYFPLLEAWGKQYPDADFAEKIVERTKAWVESGDLKESLILQPDKHVFNVGDIGHVDFSGFPVPPGVETLDLSDYPPGVVSIPSELPEGTRVYVRDAVNRDPGTSGPSTAEKNIRQVRKVPLLVGELTPVPHETPSEEELEREALEWEANAANATWTEVLARRSPIEPARTLLRLLRDAHEEPGISKCGHSFVRLFPKSPARQEIIRIHGTDWTHGIYYCNCIRSLVIFMGRLRKGIVRKQC